MLCTLNPKFSSGYCVHFTSNIGTNLKIIICCLNRDRAITIMEAVGSSEMVVSVS